MLDFFILCVQRNSLTINLKYIITSADKWDIGGATNKQLILVSKRINLQIIPGKIL